MPCGGIIKSFSVLALTLSGAGAQVQLTGLLSPTEIDERAEISNLWEVEKGVVSAWKEEEKNDCRSFIPVVLRDSGGGSLLSELFFGQEEEGTKEDPHTQAWKSDKRQPTYSAHPHEGTEWAEQGKFCRNRQKRYCTVTGFPGLCVGRCISSEGHEIGSSFPRRSEAAAWSLVKTLRRMRGIAGLRCCWFSSPPLHASLMRWGDLLFFLRCRGGRCMSQRTLLLTFEDWRANGVKDVSQKIIWTAVKTLSLTVVGHYQWENFI